MRWGAPCWARRFDERLGEESAQQRGIELHHVGQVHGEDILNRLLRHGMVAADGVDAEPGKKIEIVVPLFVVEVGTLGAGVDFVEANGALHLDEGAVEILMVQFVIFTHAGGHHPLKIE